MHQAVHFLRSFLCVVPLVSINSLCCSVTEFEHWSPASVADKFVHLLCSWHTDYILSARYSGKMVVSFKEKCKQIHLLCSCVHGGIIQGKMQTDYILSARYSGRKMKLD